jgi:predicted DCC family thiol-disulfide oxidoreductase YuxK
MASDQHVILFDGVCNFCNGMVNFLIRRDKKNVFRFAALQSEGGKNILAANGLPSDYLESLLYLEKGKIYTSSTAALKIYNQLSWYWKWTQLLWIVPRFLRDSVYNAIAKRRYKLFGKKDQCMIPSPEVRNRFLN